MGESSSTVTILRFLGKIATPDEIDVAADALEDEWRDIRSRLEASEAARAKAEANVAKLTDDCTAWSGMFHRAKADLAKAEGERDRLALELVDVNAKLTASMADKKPGDGYIGCRHCPFWKHVHYEEGGKLVAPGCSGFEPEGA